MRKEFAQRIEKLAVENEKIVFLTGDLGFMALENIKNAIGERFINVGVSEQNMISVAASLAYEGLSPICYSIAPFIVFRPAEQIRLDVCLHNLNVKIVGNGGGFGYGIMGATHHAIEDIAVLSSFQHMRCYIPFCNEDVEGVVDRMFSYNGPSYLRLGFGVKPGEMVIPPALPIRKVCEGSKITIIGLGPVLLNAYEALKNFEKNTADVFVVSEVPVLEFSEELQESIRKTKKLIIIEEHVKRGGLGEHIASLLMEKGISCEFIHMYVTGYVNGLYGNQVYHVEENGMDHVSIGAKIKALITA